jgi:hypothetical protein
VVEASFYFLLLGVVVILLARIELIVLWLAVYEVVEVAHEFHCLQVVLERSF